MSNSYFHDRACASRFDEAQAFVCRTNSFDRYFSDNRRNLVRDSTRGQFAILETRFKSCADKNFPALCRWLRALASRSGVTVSGRTVDCQNLICCYGPMSSMKLKQRIALPTKPHCYADIARGKGSTAAVSLVTRRR
jgi:hypothetical protein